MTHSPAHFRATVKSSKLLCLLAEPATNTTKQDVEQLLRKLPDDSSVEDIQYHRYVLDKVRTGLEDARVNGTITQEEVESRLSKSLTE